MARRYDSRTTIFSPDGRLYQVEYAMETISHAGTSLGILAEDGIVLAAEKKTTSALLDSGPAGAEKLFAIDGHVGCAVAGITADANILVARARLAAQRYRYTYGAAIPGEQLVQALCDTKQGYTQHGGLRPFGVSFVYAAFDAHRGFQLYHSDPAGNYAGWGATVVGANSPSAQAILKADYISGCALSAATSLAVKVLSKTMESTALTADKLEIATLTLDPLTKAPVFHVFTPAQIDALLDKEGVKKNDAAAEKK